MITIPAAPPSIAAAALLTQPRSPATATSSVPTALCRSVTGREAITASMSPARRAASSAYTPRDVVMPRTS